MLELSFEKLLVIGMIALFLLGPDRIPQAAEQLGRWVRVLRRMADDAKGRLGEELGPEFTEADWAQLDPRRYSPKRILRDALTDPGDSGPSSYEELMARTLPQDPVPAEPAPGR